MKRIFLSLILATICGIYAFAIERTFSSVCSSGQTLYYKISTSDSNHRARVVSENSSSPYYSTYPTGELVIPSSVTYNGTTYSVTYIDPYAFKDCSGLSSIIIPRSVTGFGQEAFSGCSGLTSITIPNSVSRISTSAFSSCSGLTTITIPESVTEIWEGAFSGCSGLSTINFNATNCTQMGSDSNPAFNNCNTNITINIGSNVTAIPDYAFKGLLVNGQLTIPNSVTSIGQYSFSGCKRLTSVLIPRSVTSIGSSAFFGCSGLVDMTLPFVGGSASATESSASTVIGYIFGNSSYTGGTLVRQHYQSGHLNSYYIPSGLRSVTVTGGKLFYGAFDGCTMLTSVTIGNYVTSIGSCAFSNCNGLTYITIPNSVTSIGKSAFSGCSGLVEMTIPFVGSSVSATSATISTLFGYIFGESSYTGGTAVTQSNGYTYYIPSGLRSVSITGGNLFYLALNGCTMLTSVTIGNSVTSIGNYAFYGCSGLTEVNFYATNCTTMGTSSSEPVFYGCTSFTSLNIGNDVRNIPAYAFYGCSGLSSVTIPNSVTNIGDYAFSGCSGLTTVNFNANNCTTMGSLDYPVFDGCTALSIINIGEDVRNIPAYAFATCSGMTGALTIPSSVTNIGNSAFYGCNGLTEVNFNATNCTTMGSSDSPVFDGCTLFTSLNIGNNVTNIPMYAFYGCIGLPSVIIPNSVTSIGSSAFKNCSGLMDTLTIPNSVVSVGDSAFYNCNGLSSVTIGNSVTSIGGSAFQNCNGLTGTLTIPNSVTSIGSSTFKNCNGLISVTIGNSVTSIGNSAFQNCSGLIGEMSIPNSVRSIGAGAFQNCSGLTSIPIGNSVMTIGENAFKNCSGLTSIIIPNSVYQIGCLDGPVFSGCSGLVEMTIPFVGQSSDGTGTGAMLGSIFGTSNYDGGTLVHQGDWANTYFYIPSSLRSIIITGGSNIGIDAFAGCDMLTSISIPNSVTKIWSEAFAGCSGLTEIIIPNSVREIDYSAFSSCRGLTTVTIPNSVTSIGQEAFSGCSGLTSITIGNNVTSIGNYAFYGCSGLTAVYYAGNVSGWCRIAFDHRYANPLWCAHNLYINNELITSLIIPNSVTRIKPYAFYGATCLTSVTIPNSVTKIGENAFRSCDSIVDMTIPFVGGDITATAVSDSTLFGYIFGYVYPIDPITHNPVSQPSGTTRQYYSSGSSIYAYIPSSLRSVIVTGGNLLYGAFYGCSMLTSVTIGDSVTSIGDYAFYGCSELTSVTIGNSVTSIGNSAFYGCSGLTEVTIGNSVTSIGNSAFYGCSGLTEVPIPNSVTSIGNSAFYGCSGLTEVTIPNSVTSIGGSAFSACIVLEDITIPFVGRNVLATEASASTLFGYIFGTTSYEGGTAVRQYYSSSESSFSTYYIPSSLRSVTVTGGTLLKGAFYNCSMLTTVTIGENVTSIGEWAFHNCRGLTDIYANPATPPPTTSSSFNSCTATVWVPCGSAEAYRAATGWSNFSDIRERFPYTLNVASADLTMGTASVTQQNCIEGTAVIEATPNRGYAFSQWNDGNADNPRTITVTADVEYTASFVALPTYTITAESADETRGTVTGGGIFYEGETATLTATANDGYVFGSWTDGNSDNPRTVTVTGNATYTATFKAWRTITVVSADETQGTVSGGGTYLEDAEIEISATPAEHYHFAQWNDGNIDNPRTIIVTEDATYTASFAIDRFTITVETADAEMGTVSEDGTYDYGTEIQISATPVEGYGFVAWNDGNTDNPRTITVTEDITYTATFGVLRTITVVSADETMGTVEGAGEYVEGTTIQITAIPSEHYHFAHWIVDENQTREIITDNPLTITITVNVTYTAVFAIDQHTITVESANEAMGTVSGSNTYDYGAEIQISASARNGYQFVSWNDGNTENPRTITVVEDATYIASFVSVVGIEETSAFEIALFPNPATDLLNITSSETISEIEIVNVMGQVVKRIEVNSDNAVCDVEDLKAGVYVVRIHAASATLSQWKFVKE